MTTHQALAQLAAIRDRHLAQFAELETRQQERFRLAILVSDLAVETDPERRAQLSHQIERSGGTR